MSNVVRYKLVQRVRVRCGVSDKAPVVICMVPSKLHFRIEREMVSVFFKRVHVVAECVVRRKSVQPAVFKILRRFIITARNLLLAGGL